jgi:hypothetical protein
MSKTLTVPHGNEQYPWAIWEDGEQHTAIRAPHLPISEHTFQISANSFRNSLTARASKVSKDRGIDFRCTTNVDGDKVTFRFFTVEPEKGKK